MCTKNWLSQNVEIGVVLRIVSIGMLFLPFDSMGVVINQTPTTGILSPNAAILNGQKYIQNQNRALRPQYVPGEVLVKFKDEVDAGKKTFIHNTMGATILSEIPEINVQKVKSSNGKSTEKLAQEYKNDPDVLYAEPNFIYYTQALPSDPKIYDLWGMYNFGQTGGIVDADIDAPEAWDVETGSASVIVANIDTGVDLYHEELYANIWTNPGEIPGDRKDNDRNGYVDDSNGWDFANNDNDPMDDNGHGTHTAGTIAAVGNNGIGVVGVNWRASIMPIKFLGSDGSGTLEAAAKAVLYAAKMGAKVANNSWGCDATCFSQTLLDAINVANQSGMLFVAAAGNNFTDNDKAPFYPCNFNAPNVICVSATDSRDALAGFSNYGLINVDLAAPGANILSTVPTGSCPLCNTSGYNHLNGTSMAAPHVAGAAALAISRFPSLTVAQLKNLAIGSVDFIAGLKGKSASGGRLNVNNIVRASIVFSASPIATTALAGQSSTFTVTVQSLGNFSGDVSLSLASTDTNFNGSFSPSTVTLAANGTATATLTIASAVGMRAGVYPLAVKGEYAGANGQAEARLGMISTTVQTDLAVIAVSGPSKGQAGSWFAVSDSVKNQGSALAQGFYVGYYLSTDEIATNADIRIGSRWVASLSPGAINTGTTDVWIPASFKAGTYYLGAIVDNLNQVPDSSAANNSKIANTITISGAEPESVAWVSRYNGIGNGRDDGIIIAMDSSRNTVVTGTTCKISGPDGCSDFDVTTIKYNSDGITLWTVNYDAGGPYDSPAGLALDGAGNAYVTVMYCTTADCMDQDFVTFKYDANGNSVWPTPPRYGVGMGLWDTPMALAVDGSGNSYVVGMSCNSTCFIFTTKFNSAGNQLWASQEPGYTGHSVAVDGAGNVYVTGTNATYTGSITMKYGPNGGAPLWKAYYQPNNGLSMGSNIALDAAGNVYISGTSQSDSLDNYDIATVKYDNNGNLLWSSRYDNGGYDGLHSWNTPAPKQFAVDPSGNVYVTGLSSNGLDYDYVTIKYDTNGNLMWSARYDSGLPDVPWALAIDGSGNVYVTGNNESDYATVKYGPDGHPLWFGRYDNGGGDGAFDLAVDGTGSVYVTGTSFAQSSLLDCVTIKYAVGVDLFMTSVAHKSASVRRGRNVTVDNTVKNQGTKAATSSNVGIYLSKLATATSVDSLISNSTLIGSRVVASLAAGGLSSAATSMTIPATLATGTYYVWAIADKDKSQMETDETNNFLRATGTLTVNP